MAHAASYHDNWQRHDTLKIMQQLVKLNSFLAQRGGRDDMKTFKKEFEHHVSDDPLVRWAWNPGPGRTPAPGTHAQFAKAMSVWINGGAPCPTES